MGGVLPTESNISMVGVGLLGRTTSGAGKSSRLDAAAVRSLCSVYSTSEVDTLLAGKANAATTLAGYGITDAITSAAVAAGYQPLDSDLTAIAALTTTSFGRSLLTQADAATARTTLGAGTGTIGGTVGATDNRLVRSDGTGAATVQSTGITVDDSNNVSGVGAITASGAIVSPTSIGDSATISGMTGIDLTTANCLLFRQGGTRWFGLRSIGAVFANAGGIGFAANGATSAFTSAVYEVSTGWRLQADGGLTVRNLANSADAAITAGAITANALMCAGAYTVATLPSASANAGKFAQVTDSSVTTFGSTVSGGGSNRVPVFSNGTNWVVA